MGCKFIHIIGSMQVHSVVVLVWFNPTKHRAQRIIIIIRPQGVALVQRCRGWGATPLSNAGCGCGWSIPSQDRGIGCCTVARNARCDDRDGSNTKQGLHAPVSQTMAPYTRLQLRKTTLAPRQRVVHRHQGPRIQGSIPLLSRAQWARIPVRHT